jgi:UDP-4-amino-4,6-dideoxy-N-acetyl-beta-L-altrosamine transaminase
MNRPLLGYGRQSINEDDIQAVASVLRGDFLTQGPMIERFEQALAEYVGARYAVAVANGSAALHVACMAAGLQGGSRVVTQAVTFVATANGALHCGASVGIVDIDAKTLGPDLGLLQSELARGEPVQAVLPVHVAGFSADPRTIRKVSGRSLIIEDACHALGGIEPDGAMVGGCRNSDMACFSFHPVKSITTAEGGAITTNDAELCRLARMLRNHGLERDPTRFADRAQALDDEAVNPWYYEQQRPGFNYRLTDIQAGLGLSQLTRIESFLRRRRELVLYYDQALAGLARLRPLQAAGDARRRSAHHLYLIDVEFAALGKSRRTVMDELRAKGVGAQVHYIPLYRQPFHRKPGLPPQVFPNSEAYYHGCLSIPLHPGLTDEDAELVVSSLREVCGC